MRNLVFATAILTFLTCYGCAQPPPSGSGEKHHTGRRGGSSATSPATREERATSGAVKQSPEQKLKAQTEQLLAQLGSTKYREREDAQAELQNLIDKDSPLVAVSLLKAHNSTGDPEVKMRLDKILAFHTSWGITPELITAIPEILKTLRGGSETGILGESEDQSRIKLSTAIEKMRMLKPEDVRNTLLAILRRCYGVKLRATDVLVEKADTETVKLFADMIVPRDDEEEEETEGWDWSEDDESDERDYCHYALRRLGGRAAKPLTELLCRQDSLKKCERLAQMLTELGEKGQCALIEVLEKGNVHAKEAALSNILVETIITPPLSVLEKLLKEKKPEIRGYSATFLGLVEEEKASDLLAGLLEDEDRHVRYKAAFALGERGDKRAFPLLKEALKEEDVDLRHEAVLALGGIKDGCVVEPLVSAFSDSSYGIKNAARESLDRLSATVTPEIMKVYENPDCQFRVRVFEIVISRGWYRKDLAKILVRAVKDPNQYIRRSALSTMSAMKSREFLDFYIAALKDTYSEMRCIAWNVLRKLKDQKAVEPLITLLKTGTRYDKAGAAYTLSEIGGTRAFEVVVEAYDRGDIGLTSWVVKALRAVDKRDVVPLLIEALQDKKWGVRGSVVKCLAKYGDKRALEPLLAALKTKSSDAYIPEAMRKIAGKKAIPYLVKGIPSRFSGWVLEQLLMFGEDAIVPLRGALQSPEGNRRGLVLEALIMLRDKETHKLLLDDLKNPDNISTSLARRLLTYGDRSGVKALLANEDTYQAGIFMLAELGDKRALNPLLKMLSGEPRELDRAAVAEALGRLGDEAAVEPLISMLLEDEESDEAYERNSAAEALGAFKDSRAVDALIKALSDESEKVQRIAAQSLARIGDRRAVESLMNMPVSDFTAAALRKFCAPETVDYFLKIVNNRPFITDARQRLTYGLLLREPLCGDECKITAVYALGEIGDRRAVEPLRWVLSTEMSYLSMAAAWGLLRLDDEAGAKALKEGNVYDLSWTVMDSPSEKALPWLIEALGEDAYDSFAARALGKLGGREAANALVAALEKHPDSYVINALSQVEEAKTLEKKVYGKMIAALTSVLEKNDSRRTRQAAQKALEKITDQDFGYNFQAWRRWHIKRQ